MDQNGDAINLREGQTVTVELKYENDSTESNDFTSAKTITAVITGTANGVNSVQIVNNIQNDSDYEGNESYTLSIDSISTNVTGLGTVFAHETNGVKDSVTGTITDEFDNIKAQVSIVDADDINTVVDASSGTVETAKITGAINFGDTITKLVVSNGSQNVEIDPSIITVQADGTFIIENVDVSGLNDGVLTVKLDVSNSSGNTASDTDTVDKDTIAEISISSAVINDTTGVVSGTVTDVEPGRMVSIKFIDDGGYEVRTTTTVKADGSWEISEDVSSLTHGDIKVGVFVNDNAGNPGETCQEDIGSLNTPPVANDRHLDLDCSTDTYSTGLKSEYYGVDSQIHNLTEFKAIVDGNDPDATFTATNINYGYGTGSVGLGTNLQTFLKGDASSLSNDPADSSDAGIKLYGKVFLAAGTYNFKVYADDGYDITVNGQNVADFETNQSPGTKVHNDFTIAEDGYYDIEMLWWDQGGAYVFQPQISSDGGATYKFLDSSMLFTQETSTSDESSIEFKMENFVSDVEDDANSTIVKIRIDSLPEEGVLTVNGTAVKVGDIYDETAVIKYTANSNIEDTLYGTTADSGTLAEWGTITNGVITTADGNATIKAYNNGVIGEVGFSSENNNNSHDGLGLGVVSPDGDDDQIEGSSGEKLVVEFKEIVTNAEIGLSSLGTYFTSDSIDSKAHWVAFKNGVEVASGDVQQSTGDSNDTTNSFKIDTEFDKIEFTSVSTLNANYSIQYMNIDYKVDDSFKYTAIDSDDKESSQANVTIDLETTGCTLRDDFAESADLSLVLGQATVIDGGSRDLPDVTQTHPIGKVLGDQKGDGNIYGSTPPDYDESYTKLLDFGVENAGKTVTLSIDVTVNGSWNHGSHYYDDNWSIFVNSEQKAIYKYSSDNRGNPDDYVEVNNNGVTEYRYGNSGENSNISNFTHTTIPIVVTLNAQGKANVVLAASSTEKAEKVTINSITTVLDGGVEELPDTYVYPIDIAAVLSDTDGSETLTVRLEGVPSSAVFTSSMTLTDKGNGIWEIEIPAGQKSIDADITMRISESDNDFNLVAIAKSTESENSSETETMTFSDETIDLESIAKPSYEIDTLDLENNIRQTISLDLDDVIDLTDSDNELVIKGDLSDKVDLDNTEWTNSGTQEIDGSNYNVYTGLGANSTVKLLIDDDIEITPDI